MPSLFNVPEGHVHSYPFFSPVAPYSIIYPGLISFPAGLFDNIEDFGHWSGFWNAWKAGKCRLGSSDLTVGPSPWYVNRSTAKHVSSSLPLENPGQKPQSLWDSGLQLSGTAGL